MANIILTTNCQRNCEYCFAQDDKNNNKEFTWPNFVEAVGFIGTSQKTINLLGGEPTLHKEFTKMLEYLLVNDYVVQVFTNGMVSSETLNNINKVLNRTVLRKDQLYFAVNINEAKYRNDIEVQQQKRFLEYIGHLAYPSFTIQDKGADLLFLQHIINEFNLDRTIRIGLALPVIGVKNKHLSKDDYSEVAKSITELANNSEGTTIKFDCGFPLCMFSLDEIGKLSLNEENDFAFMCGQPLDIYSDLTITNCYPLSKLHRVPISNFVSLNDAYKYFETGFMTPTGIYGSKCSECTFFRKVCWGGCKGFYKGDNNEQV